MIPQHGPPSNSAADASRSTGANREAGGLVSRLPPEQEQDSGRDRQQRRDRVQCAETQNARSDDPHEHELDSDHDNPKIFR